MTDMTTDPQLSVFQEGDQWRWRLTWDSGRMIGRGGYGTPEAAWAGGRLELQRELAGEAD